MLALTYPSLRAFVAACHAANRYALALIIDRTYAIRADGAVIAV